MAHRGMVPPLDVFAAADDLEEEDDDDIDPWIRSIALDLCSSPRADSGQHVLTPSSAAAAAEYLSNGGDLGGQLGIFPPLTSC